jgi:hypothetical protein
MVTKHIQITQNDHRQQAFAVAKAAGNHHYQRTTTTMVRESLDLGLPFKWPLPYSLDAVAGRSGTGVNAVVSIGPLYLSKTLGSSSKA